MGRLARRGAGTATGRSRGGWAQAVDAGSRGICGGIFWLGGGTDCLGAGEAGHVLCPFSACVSRGPLAAESKRNRLRLGTRRAERTSVRA